MGHPIVLSCVVCNCCWLVVCIAVVVLCVFCYVYLLYYVCIVVFDVEYIYGFVMLGVCTASR